MEHLWDEFNRLEMKLQETDPREHPFLLAAMTRIHARIQAAELRARRAAQRRPGPPRHPPHPRPRDGGAQRPSAHGKR